MEQQAHEYATRMHNGQTRSDGTPYILHPQRVYNKLKQLGISDEDTLVAALLHDTLEDTQATTEEIQMLFGNRVLDLVLELTSNNDEISKLGKEQHRLFLSGDEYSTKDLALELQQLGYSNDVIMKRQGKALYLLSKIQTMSQEARWIKLSDRLDNVVGACQVGGKFKEQYLIETKFIVHQLVSNNNVERDLLDEIRTHL